MYGLYAYKAADPILSADADDGGVGSTMRMMVVLDDEDDEEELLLVSSSLWKMQLYRVLSS